VVGGDDWPLDARRFHRCVATAGARSILSESQAVEQVEAELSHVELTHGGKPPLVALQTRLRWAPCSKSQTGAGRVACHPTVAALRGTRSLLLLLYYYTIHDPACCILSSLPSSHLISSSSLASAFFVLLPPSRTPTVAVDPTIYYFPTSIHSHQQPHTVNMKYQLIALPALAATVAAQDLYVDCHATITC